MTEKRALWLRRKEIGCIIYRKLLWRIVVLSMKLKNIFVGQKGLRAGWLLAAALLLYFVCTGGVYSLYWFCYREMMEVWGVTSANIIRAPRGVQFLYQWSNVIVQLLQNALLIGGAMILRRIGGSEEKRTVSIRSMGIGAGIGAACVAGIWCILMLLDSVRLGWRITQAAFSINTFALLLTTLSAALGETIFLYNAMYNGLEKRIPAWGAVVVIMIFRAMVQGLFAPMILINYALTALVCCLLMQQYGTGAAAAFRFAWNYLEQAVFGFAGASAALYETYPVNLYWLNGGNSGIMAGILTSVVLIGVCALLLRKARCKA